MSFGAGTQTAHRHSAPSAAPPPPRLGPPAWPCSFPNASSACQAPELPPESQQTRFSKCRSHRKAERCKHSPRGPPSPLPRGAFHLCGSSSTHSNEGPSPSSAPPHPVPSLRLYSHGHLLPGPARMLISHRGRLRFQEAQCPRGCTWRSPSMLPGLPDPPAHLSATTELSRCV